MWLFHTLPALDVLLLPFFEALLFTIFLPTAMFLHIFMAEGLPP